MKPEQISRIIRAQIKHYANAIEQNETGVVTMVGDGIARASGLDKCMAGEDVYKRQVERRINFYIFPNGPE